MFDVYYRNDQWEANDQGLECCEGEKVYEIFGVELRGKVTFEGERLYFWLWWMARKGWVRHQEFEPVFVIALLAHNVNIDFEMLERSTRVARRLASDPNCPHRLSTREWRWQEAFELLPIEWDPGEEPDDDDIAA